jgi:hypothetical protein
MGCLLLELEDQDAGRRERPELSEKVQTSHRAMAQEIRRLSGASLAEECATGNLSSPSRLPKD